jgi:hypothetical protein
MGRRRRNCADVFIKRRQAFADDDPEGILLENALLTDIRAATIESILTSTWGEVCLFQDGSALSASYRKSRALVPYSRLSICTVNSLELREAWEEQERECAPWESQAKDNIPPNLRPMRGAKRASKNQ